jgi:hypothetical protein
LEAAGEGKWDFGVKMCFFGEKWAKTAIPTGEATAADREVTVQDRE